MDEKITIQELESSENTDNTVVTDTITDNTTTATVAVTSSSVELEVASEITEKVAEKTEKKTRSRKAKKTETVSTTEEKAVSETTTTKEETTSETVKQYKAKDVFDTRCALLYKSPLAPKCIKGVRGRFYVWSGDVVNNRIRLTDSPSGVGKPGRIIGWVDIDK